MVCETDEAVFTTIENFLAGSEAIEGKPVTRIVHCVNPFPASPGTEHYKAQNVTYASMTQAREFARLRRPDIVINFASVTLEDDVQTPSIEFDIHAKLERSAADIMEFRVPRPLPVMMDVLTAVSVEPQDIFVFTNVDIALVPDFYSFITSLFERGVDSAIINRRTISDIYKDKFDLPLMAGEVGAPHPGFDCFAFRGSLRDQLLHYDGLVGIGGVMLPLVHQLLAMAARPVVLLDAHATFHLGNDREWSNDDFADYTKHNTSEIDRVFGALLEKDEFRIPLLNRLKQAHKGWVFPRRLRQQAGINHDPDPKLRRNMHRTLLSKLKNLLKRH